MGFFTRIRLHPTFIRLTNWEYWNINLVYAPVFPYYLFLCLKARSFFFWSAANPAISNSGMMGVSKNGVLALLPEQWKPICIFIPLEASNEFILEKMLEKGLQFPIFMKPDIGERGSWAKKIDSEAMLIAYRNASPKMNWLVQEFITCETEFAVLHFRLPDAPRGHISSLTLKKFLSVVGDGSSSVLQLVEKYPRAILQLERLKKDYARILPTIPAKGEVVKLGVVGNHCLGTEFLNGNHLIDEALIRTFDGIQSSMKGVFFARYDLKCPSIEDLRCGKNIKIMEINGVGSEPAHIYDKSNSFYSRYRDLHLHHKYMYEVGIANQSKGIIYMNWQDVKAWYQHIKTYYATWKV